MRILIVSSRQESGGDPLGTLTKRVLTDCGHEARLFIAGASASDTGLAGLRQMFGLDDDVRRLRELIAMWRPEVVHVTDPRPGASSALAMTARECGVRTLWSISSFAPMCPSGDCRTPSGAVCEECIHGRRKVMVYRCVGGSTMASLIAMVRSMYWDVRRLSGCADVFVAPSGFMRSKMLESGFPSRSVSVVPWPCETPGETSGRRGDYFCFLADLTSENGAETAAKAAIAADVDMTVIGNGPLLRRLRELARRAPRLTVISDADNDTRRRILAEAKGCVVAAETYLCGADAVKESLCAGTPVIASAIADIPEMTSPADGITFNPGNAEELATILRDFDKRHAFNHRDIAAKARSKYSESAYYKNLMSLYGN